MHSCLTCQLYSKLVQITIISPILRPISKWFYTHVPVLVLGWPMNSHQGAICTHVCPGLWNIYSGRWRAWSHGVATVSRSLTKPQDLCWLQYFKYACFCKEHITNPAAQISTNWLSVQAEMCPSQERQNSVIMIYSYWVSVMATWTH